MKASEHRERLIWFGIILFLLGLLVGFVSPAFKNPRLALSAHLEGVMNGMFLVLMGVIWERVRLSARQTKLAYGLLILAGYLNYLACALGGILGASRMTPIAGKGFTALPWQENLVAGMFGIVGVTMTVGVGLLVWGLRPRK